MNTGDSRVPFAAARAVAAAHGVRCDDAVVIAAGSNVLVHLKPSPVVARVMTGTAALHGDIASWLEREVAVGVFVAERGGPVVPPSDLLAPGPYQDHRLWMTLWKFVAQELADGSPDARAVGHSLREVGGMANAAVSEEGVDAFEPVIPVQKRPRDLAIVALGFTRHPIQAPAMLGCSTSSTAAFTRSGGASLRSAISRRIPRREPWRRLRGAGESSVAFTEIALSG